MTEPEPIKLMFCPGCGKLMTDDQGKTLEDGTADAGKYPFKLDIWCKPCWDTKNK